MYQFKALEELSLKLPILKRLSDTRWSAWADATKALSCNFTSIRQFLDGIFNNMDHKVECRNQALKLISKWNKL